VSRGAEGVGVGVGRTEAPDFFWVRAASAGRATSNAERQKRKAKRARGLRLNERATKEDLFKLCHLERERGRRFNPEEREESVRVVGKLLHASEPP
jgi:hypothetical protein